MYLYKCLSDDGYKFVQKEIIISWKFIFTCWIKMCKSSLQNGKKQKKVFMPGDIWVQELWGSNQIIYKRNRHYLLSMWVRLCRWIPRKFLHSKKSNKNEFPRLLKENHMSSKSSLVDKLPVSTNDRKHIKVDLTRWW